MRFYYVSCWKSVDGQKFRLSGVIVAGSNALGGYFPQNADEQADWDEAMRGVEIDAEGNPEVLVAFLGELSQRGNGINEEYDEVLEIDGPDLQQAMRKAYREAKKRYGTEMELYEPMPNVTVELLEQ